MMNTFQFITTIQLTWRFPDYAERTLERTIRETTPNTVDLFIITDDCSQDGTVRVAERLASEFPIQILRHPCNLGYGANQKTCYRAALEAGADVVVMLHPDYQYDPRLLGALAGLVSSGVYDVALASRILGKTARAGGMPLYKYVANRALTFVENHLIRQHLSEYHTGYRAYSRQALESAPFELNSDDFVFDNQILVQLHLAGFRIGELAVPARYLPEASSINFTRSIRYGLGVLACSLAGLAARLGLTCRPGFRTTKYTNYPKGKMAKSSAGEQTTEYTEHTEKERTVRPIGCWRVEGPARLQRPGAREPQRNWTRNKTAET